ncbi:hypothetical protein BGX28_002851 [Mortierella sp. GBA30]|nr:hypothetical protein BGX28_002851 [Mortierella sp. GBA30]
MDDDADWGEALNDSDMEEAVAAVEAVAASTAISGGASTKSGGSAQDNAGTSQTEVDAYEIDEPFLPPQRETKRARFDFDDFD